MGRGKGAPPLDPLLAPLDVRLLADTAAPRRRRRLSSRFGRAFPVSLSVNPSQLRLLADVKAAFPRPLSPSLLTKNRRCARRARPPSVGGRATMELASSAPCADATLYGRPLPRTTGGERPPRRDDAQSGALFVGRRRAATRASTTRSRRSCERGVDRYRRRGLDRSRPWRPTYSSGANGLSRCTCSSATSR